MRHTKVHKNHVLLTLLFNLFVMMIVAIIAFSFLMQSAIYNFTRDCKRNDDTASKMARIVKSKIEENEDFLTTYADELVITGEETDAEINSKLKTYCNLGAFQTVYYMKPNGNIITANKSKLVDINQKALYDELSTNKRINTIFKSTEDTIIYAYQIVFHNQPYGWILGTDEAHINSNELGESISEDTGITYILDRNKNVLLYSRTDKTDISYSDIKPTSFYVKSEKEQEKVILGLLGNVEGKQIKGRLTRDETALQLAGLKQMMTNEDNVFWYEKSVIIDNTQQFYVLYGKVAYPSDETINSVKNGLDIVFMVLLVFFILIILLVCTQARANRSISKVAYLDSVTQWPNWNRFVLDVSRMLKRNKKKKYAMVSFDIKQFRVISELDGYQKGEEILQQITGILRTKMRKGELFTRFAVDNFALLLRYATREELLERLRILDTNLSGGLSIKGTKFKYGIYYLDDYAMDVNRMYAYSAMAKDTVKKSHDSNVGIFTEKIRGTMLREKELENCMESALKNKEFLVYLQPKYSSDGSKIAGAEALVRWSSPTLGFISPGDFIPLFEKNGFIMELDRYMIREVCRLQKEWMDQGKELVTISVNVSRVHLLDEHLVENIKKWIDEFGIPYSCIELELTESAFFDDKAAIFSTVTSLRELGFKVSMDDFGSGYSSLNSLKDLSLDVIKLDRDFFNNNGNAERGEIVIRDTISLAKHLKMEIVAEGIETKEQVEFLRELGCDLIQGFYFAKPMPINDFEKLIGYTVREE